MADRLELAGDSEARGRNGWYKPALVVRRPGAVTGELRFDFYSKIIGRTAPVILALSPADRVALARFLLEGTATESEALYAVADDWDRDVLDRLRREAGITWDCYGPEGESVCWTNVAANTVCDHCQTPRPKEDVHA